MEVCPHSRSCLFELCIPFLLFFFHMTEEWPCLLSLIKNYLRLLDMNDLESLSPGQMGAVNYTKAGSFMYLSSIYF